MISSTVKKDSIVIGLRCDVRTHGSPATGHPRSNNPFGKPSMAAQVDLYGHPTSGEVALSLARTDGWLTNEKAMAICPECALRGFRFPTLTEKKD